MNTSDVLVGLISVGLGLVVVIAAWQNKDHYFELKKTAWLQGRLGRAGLRVFCFLLGLLLVVLGIAIAYGFGPFKTVTSLDLRPSLDHVYPVSN